LRYNAGLFEQRKKAVYLNARVAELVDALDLGSSAVRRESSSLSFRTKYIEAFLDRKAFFVPGVSSLAENYAASFVYKSLICYSLALNLSEAVSLINAYFYGVPTVGEII
jgi:hypothetical protein